MLASASSCLKELFIKSPQTNLVISVDASEQAIQALLAFMYSGQLNTQQYIVIQELHSISNAWQLITLSNLCEEAIINKQRQLQGLAMNNAPSPSMSPKSQLGESHQQTEKNGLDLGDPEEEEIGVRNGRGNLMLGSVAKPDHAEERAPTLCDTETASDMELEAGGSTGGGAGQHKQQEALVEQELGMKAEPTQDEDSYGKMPGGLVVADEDEQEHLQNIMMPQWKVKQEKDDAEFGDSMPSEGQMVDPMLSGANPLVYSSSMIDANRESPLVSVPIITQSSGMAVPSGPGSTVPAIPASGVFFKCFVCKLLFTDMQACGSHLVSQHNVDKNSTIPIETVVPTHPEDAPRTEHSLDSKMANGDMTLYQCTECNKHFWSLARCRTHIMNKHGKRDVLEPAAMVPMPIMSTEATEQETTEWTKDQYHCYICKMTFPDAHTGRSHSLRYHCHPRKKKEGWEKEMDRLVSLQDSPVDTGVASPPAAEPKAAKSASRPKTRRSGSSKSTTTRQVLPSDTDQSLDNYPFPNHPYQCNFCKNVFEGLTECEEHIHEDHNISRDLVYVCYTRRKNRYKKAMLQGTRVEKSTSSASVYDVPDNSSSPFPSVSPTPSASDTQTPTDPALVCKVGDCSKVIANTLDMAYHKFIDHDITLPTWVANYQCPKCGKMCRTKAALSSHLTIVHRPEDPFLTNLPVLLPTMPLLNPIPGDEDEDDDA